MVAQLGSRIHPGWRRLTKQRGRCSVGLAAIYGDASHWAKDSRKAVAVKQYVSCVLRQKIRQTNESSAHLCLIT